MRAHQRGLGSFASIAAIAVAVMAFTASPARADFASYGLAAHNAKRALHVDTPNLVDDATLRTLAQTAATSLAASDVLSHQVVLGVLDAAGVQAGVNLYWKTGAATARDAVNSWYSEIQNYEWHGVDDVENFDNGTGHFTQVVWASSTRLGMAKAVSASGRTYIVALYGPPGNFLGEFRHNVRPLK